MRVLTHRIDCPTDQYRLDILPIGDVHIGAAACDEALLRQAVRYIQAEPHRRWIGMGDYIDAIQHQDAKRFAPGGIAPWLRVADLADVVKHQVARFLDIMAPVADRCLGLLAGNHEDAVTKYHSRDAYGEIVVGLADVAGVSPERLHLGYEGWVRLQFTRPPRKYNTITLYCHHGHGGGRKDGAKALRMSEVLREFTADVALMGHTHSSQVSSAVVTRLSAAGSVVEDVRLGVWTGCYLATRIDGHTTYSARSGYPTVRLGGNELLFAPFADNPARRVGVASWPRPG